MRKQYGLKFDDSFIARVDEAAKRNGVTRTGLIEALVEWGLERAPLVSTEDERLPLGERQAAFERATRRVPS